MRTNLNSEPATVADLQDLERRLLRDLKQVTEKNRKLEKAFNELERLTSAELGKYLKHLEWIGLKLDELPDRVANKGDFQKIRAGLDRIFLMMDRFTEELEKVRAGRLKPTITADGETIQ